MKLGQRQDNPELEQPLVSHLLELRDRLLRIVAAVFIIFLCLFPFANTIYAYVAQPLMAHLPEGTSMIATEVASPFLTPFKLSLVAAVFLAMPYILFQLWGFIAPGLYKHEKRLATPLLVSSIILFYVGMLFAYYVVFPLIFAFLTGTAPEGVAVMTDISRYLDFVLTLFFAFGVAFEVPIAIILLVWMGVVNPDNLASKRPYIVVAAFTVGMLLTPPDVISQTLLAIPMLILFEVGVWVSRWFVRDKERRSETEAEPDDRDVVVFRTPAPARSSARPSAAAATAAETLVGSDLAASTHEDADRFVPMTDQEMEDELAAIEAQEEAAEAVPDGEEEGEEAEVEVEPEAPSADPVQTKLEQVQSLRGEGDVSAARSLLYEVLEQGNADQRNVARNILKDMDTP